jgi:hypothetical protein
LGTSTAIFVGKQRVTGEKLAEFIYAQNKLFKRMAVLAVNGL